MALRAHQPAHATEIALALDIGSRVGAVPEAEVGDEPAARKERDNFGVAPTLLNSDGLDGGP